MVIVIVMANMQALYYAGTFLLHIDRADKAKEYVDRLLKINPQSKEGLILKGWMEVSLLREAMVVVGGGRVRAARFIPLT